MSTLRISCNKFFKYIGAPAIKNNLFSNPIHQNNTLLRNIQKRSLVTHKLTNDINYLTNDNKLEIKVDPKTFKLTKTNGNPLCIMLCWLGSTPKNIDKYSSIFLEQGYDLVTAQIQLKQSLWPDPPVKKTAMDILNFCQQNLNSFGPSIVYGFSIGSYLWSELLLLAEKDLERYRPTLNLFRAQIWDSLVNYDGFKNGVAKALFPNNKIAAFLLETYLHIHMERNYNVTTIHYLNGSKAFPRNHCEVPALHYCSKTDQVGTYSANMDYISAWKAKGIQVQQKVFDESPHVQHYYYHQKEYLTELYNFMGNNQLLFKPELLQKRIDNAKVVPLPKRRK